MKKKCLIKETYRHKRKNYFYAQCLQELGLLGIKLTGKTTSNQKLNNRAATILISLRLQCNS